MFPRFRFSNRLLTVFLLLIGGKAFSQTTIQMKKENGVYTVPCTVNGLPLKFIFDTGASDVIISLTEADFMLKNGLLKEEDIIGKQSYQTATGSISEGVKIILREIKFGDIKLTNVVASVVLTDKAPLLLGQSVLTRIGKYQIDPLHNTLIITPQNNNTTATTVTDIEGNVYPTIQIGSQVWMAENLKVNKYNNGEPIAKIMDDQRWTNAFEGAYCYYDNDKANVPIYGNLYNWYAVVDSRGICPFGWHVPAESEFKALTTFLNSQDIKSGALKATRLWTLPNDSATNLFNFSALPGGKRWHNSGRFEFATIGGYFWTSSSHDYERAYYYAFSFDYTFARISHFMRNDGFSCRCIKD